MPNRTRVTESPLSCLQSIGVDFIDRDCPPHHLGSHYMPNRTRVTESPLSCLKSIIRDFIDCDCLPQTQAVTDHGIEPRWLLAILLAQTMCDRRVVNVHYQSTKRLWRNELTFFHSPFLLGELFHSPFICINRRGVLDFNQPVRDVIIEPDVR